MNERRLEKLLAAVEDVLKTIESTEVAFALDGRGVPIWIKARLRAAVDKAKGGLPDDH
mgnify:CR=1 FL=1